MSNTFGARLERILIDRNMTQTDLARLVWDEKYTDKRGYVVVKGKDQISGYVNGRRQPSALVYNKILQVLRLNEDDLPLRRRQVREMREHRAEELNKHLIDELTRITAERDHWRDTARQLSGVVATLAAQMKERHSA